MNIIIQRDRPHGEYVHGQLTIDGTRVCHTLENTDSRVPAGIYTVTLLKCKQYARKMPCLVNHHMNVTPILRALPLT